MHVIRSCLPPPPRTVERAITAAFWLGLALGLTVIGVFIANALDSTLLGVLCANLLAVVTVSIFMAGGSGGGRSPTREWR